MSKSTGKKIYLCMDRFNDLSLEIHKSISGISTGSPDPHAADFDPTAYLASELLSKHPALAGGCSESERREKAFEKLFLADGRCHRLNEQGFSTAQFSAAELSNLQTIAQTLIGNLLRDFEHHWLEDGTFSNGASMGFKLQDAAPYKKFAGQATVTPRMYALAVGIVKTDPNWYGYCLERFGCEENFFKVVPGNGLFTVPKNSEIDRAACKEPDMNMYAQKACGGFIRRRLRAVGIDLNDQTRNQELARLGSLDGSLATIDLSSASDSISDRLVWSLLPPHIYSFLDVIRSHRAVLPDGTTRRWGLFSTMGNGFTFELETLLFWSIAKACALLAGNTGTISIYGDDIIVPSEIAESVINALEAFGFIPNRKKTFTTGFFRESCGAHYYRGIDVKPFYIRQPITGLRELLHILNRIRGWGNVVGMADPRLYETWAKYASFVPDELKGGCDTERTDYLVTPGLPCKRLAENVTIRSGFDHQWSVTDDCGRFVAWLHRGSGEIISTEPSGRFVIRTNKEWSTAVPTFPQEVEDAADLPS